LLNLISYNIFWELDYLFFNNSFFNWNNIYSLYFINIFLLKYSIFLIFILFILFYLIFNFSKIKNKVFLVNNYSNFLKFISLYSFISSSFLFFVYIYIYLYILSSYNNFFYNSVFFIAPNYYCLGFKINFDFFGIILLFLSFVCGLLSVISLDNKIFFKNIKYLFYLNVFIIIVFFYVSSNNILILFISYELLLLPSFILVFFLSPSRKSTHASLFFLFLSQFGFFLVFCFVFSLTHTHTLTNQGCFVDIYGDYTNRAYLLACPEDIRAHEDGKLAQPCHKNFEEIIRIIFRTRKRGKNFRQL